VPVVPLGDGQEGRRMLTRQWSQLRDAEIKDEGRTLILACVPFDTPARVDDGEGPYREVFRHGAFRSVASAPNRVELRYRHDQSGAPYGFGIALVEDSQYLLGHFRVAPSAAGDQLLSLVRDDQLGGVSIGYIAGQSREGADADGPLIERMRVKVLHEVSLTNAATYADAKVLALREQDMDSEARAIERERLFWTRQRISQIR
jgi:HK97 family phage prohead protease